MEGMAEIQDTRPVPERVHKSWLAGQWDRFSEWANREPSLQEVAGNGMSVAEIYNFAIAMSVNASAQAEEVMATHHLDAGRVVVEVARQRIEAVTSVPGRVAEVLRDPISAVQNIGEKAVEVVGFMPRTIADVGGELVRADLAGAATAVREAVSRGENIFNPYTSSAEIALLAMTVAAGLMVAGTYQPVVAMAKEAYRMHKTRKAAPALSPRDIPTQPLNAANTAK